LWFTLRKIEKGRMAQAAAIVADCSPAIAH
jgi:hypothetical protein